LGLKVFFSSKSFLSKFDDKKRFAEKPHFLTKKRLTKKSLQKPFDEFYLTPIKITRKWSKRPRIGKLYTMIFFSLSSHNFPPGGFCLTFI